ncbi:MAG: hypothetical protein GY939_12710, partial [Actinomycetia bacterium]|nr:hypothetical protein [Actinomycetes bacterium]
HLPPISSTADGLTARLWHLQRTARRDELRSQGVTVVTWSANQPLELPVAAVARRGRDRRAGVRR